MGSATMVPSPDELFARFERGEIEREYRWSSYGETVGGGKKGNGKKAREGLLRAYLCDQGVGYEAGKWD